MLHLIRRPLLALGIARVDVVSRGVDTELFAPHRRSAGLRRQWGLGPDDLAFSPVEVGLAATAMGQPLTRGRAAELQKLTNGWPVAVRLALMSLP